MGSGGAEASDVTKHGRHLGFYQELESGKNDENFCA